MVVSLVYLLFRRALAVAALRSRSREFKELEIVVLRHELAVLRRQVARPRLEKTDRVFLAAASRLLSGAGWQSFFVRPETLLGWHASSCGGGGPVTGGDPGGQGSRTRSARWWCVLRVRTRAGAISGSSVSSQELPPCLGRPPRGGLDPAAGSTRQCWPRSGYRVRRARPGSGGSPNPGSPGPAARSAPADRRRLRACRAVDADRSNVAPRGRGASDGSSPAARTDCPTAHAEASGPVRPGTSDRLAAAWPVRLPTKHREFVTQNEYLDLVRGV
jgi:hypothetical protein